MGDIAVRALTSEMADLQRIINADEAMLAHEKDPDKRKALIDEIDCLQDEIGRIRRRRDSLQFG